MRLTIPHRKGKDGKPTIVRPPREGRRGVHHARRPKAQTSPRTICSSPTKKGIALAGVMGGQNSEIKDNTVDVLIESAISRPQTSAAQARRSDCAPMPAIVSSAARTLTSTTGRGTRCAQLILETAGGQIAEGSWTPIRIRSSRAGSRLRHHKVNELLGIELRPEEIEFYLGQLGLKTIGRKVRPVGANAAPEPVTFQIPTFRVDLKREVDLIEEIAPAARRGQDCRPPRRAAAIGTERIRRDARRPRGSAPDFERAGLA